ncbi:MAG: TonB-dependent receptor [Opitutaceae bacterium]|nr:TonB-dependent receptor [Opitutaceae bacterium]
MLPTRILLLTAAFAVAATVRAQTGPAVPAAATPAVTLDPIRVTADLWAAPLARISASVSVYDEAALRTGAVRHFGDLVGQIPNLTFTGATSRPRYLQIRGVGENSQYEGETPDSTVRFLLDDLDFTGLGSLGGTFDLQQVEVLRGPQAGAFGANAAGGVVRLVSNAPTPYWTGLVETTAGGDDLRAGGFAVGGPLLARRPTELMARLSVHRSVSDGFRHNVTLNRATHARDELNARLRLEWNPSAAWRWESTLLYSELDSGFDDFALDNNGRRTFSDQPGRDEQDSLAASLRGTWTGRTGLRFSTVTGVTRVDSTYSYDDDWTAASYQGFSDLRRDRAVLSQEFRLDSAAGRAAGWIDRWTVGVYGARTREDGVYTNEDPGNLRGLRTDYDARHAALFGQVAHAFDARNRLILGLRVERLDLEGRGTRTRFRKGRGTFDPAVTFRPECADTMAGGKVTFEHDLSDHQLVFVSATRGYKGGGVNLDARINPPADPLTYGTEYLWNYEAGLRGSGLGRRLTGELTAFLLERRDAQVRDSAGFGGSYRFFTANANDARVYGLEAAGAFAVTRAWSLHGSLARMESELGAFTLTNGNTGGGRRLANTPRYGYSVGARYRGETGFFGQAELTGRAAQFDSNNQNEARRAFAVVNASVGYTWRNWTFTLWGRNLLDRRYENRVFFFGNEDPDYVEQRYESRADPRQVGVSAAWRF